MKKIKVKLVSVILILFVTACSTSQKRNCVLENSLINTKDPIWFKDINFNKDYLYRVRNKESSGEKTLAKQKNLIIAKLKMANLVATDFMTCEDQNQMVEFVRSSNTINQLSKIKNNRLIDNIISGYEIINEEIHEHNSVFTSYILISKTKK